MHFAHPILLLLLLLVPPAVWLRHRRMRKKTMQFSSADVLLALPATWRIRLQPLLPACLALGMACWIVAMARPQRGLDDSIVRTEAVDIILLLDLSESMDTRDFVEFNQRISRLEASKDVIKRFLEKRPDDRIKLSLTQPWAMKGGYTLYLPKSSGDSFSRYSFHLRPSSLSSKASPSASTGRALAMTS